MERRAAASSLDAAARRHMDTPMRKLIATVACAFGLGCHVGAPLMTPRPAAGTRVQVTLTDAGSAAMAAQLGPSRVELVGDVTSTNDSSLVIAVRAVTNRRGIEELWVGEQATVPRSAIAAISTRTVSRGRSIVLALLTSAVIVALGAAIGNGGTGPEPGGGPGSTQ